MWRPAPWCGSPGFQQLWCNEARMARKSCATDSSMSLASPSLFLRVGLKKWINSFKTIYNWDQLRVEWGWGRDHRTGLCRLCWFYSLRDWRDLKLNTSSKWLGLVVWCRVWLFVRLLQYVYYVFLTLDKLSRTALQRRAPGFCLQGSILLSRRWLLQKYLQGQRL